MTFTDRFLPALVLSLTAGLAQADPNVALGATVSYVGTGFGAYSSTWGAGALAQAATVTDGVYVPESQQWNVGSLFWVGAGDDTEDSVTITLPEAATISGLSVQADDNDTYHVAWRDVGGLWHSDIDVPTVPSFGLVTRTLVLGSPITATAFTITASGDAFYGLSEFQAYGNFVSSVPEPAALALMAAGLGALALRVRARMPAHGV
jgi:hypothetical protein